MLLPNHPREFRHRGMQREEGIQHERRMRAIGRKRDRSVQAGVIGIADRSDRGKTVQRAAQDHDDQARIAAVGGAREFRQISPGGKGGAAEQQRSAR